MAKAAKGGYDGKGTKIIKNLSQILKLNKENIGLKAKTSEKMGFIGNNDGAAAQTIIKISR